MSSKKQDTEQVLPTPDNVGQIREILFGDNMRAVDERFETVESRLSKESATLKKSLEKRILELENLLGEFRDKAGDELNRESVERDAGLGTLQKSLAEFRLDAENQLAELQSDFSNEIKQVRQELSAAQKALVSDFDSLQATHTKSSDRLGVDKVDRGELAGFLSDIAGRLVPTAKKRSK